MDKAEEFATMAHEEVSEGDFKTATKLFTKAINHNNNNFRLYLDRALCNQKLGNHRESLDDCEAAIKLDNRNYQCHYQKACALANTAQLTQAETSFKKAIELQTAEESTTLIDIYTLLCNALVKLNQFSHIGEAHHIANNILPPITLSNNNSNINNNLVDDNYSRVNGVNDATINNKSAVDDIMVRKDKRSNSCQVFGANDAHRANNDKTIDSNNSHNSNSVLLNYNTVKKSEDVNSIANQPSSLIKYNDRLPQADLQRHTLLFNQALPHQQQMNYIYEPMRYGLDHGSDIYGNNKLLSHQRGQQKFTNFFDVAPYQVNEHEPSTYGPIGPHLNKQVTSDCSQINKAHNINGDNNIDDTKSRMDIPFLKDSRIKSKSVSGDMMSSTETLTSRDKVNFNNHGSLLGQSSVDSGLSISQDGNDSSFVSPPSLSRITVNNGTHDKLSRCEESAKLYNYESEWFFRDFAKVRALSIQTQDKAQNNATSKNINSSVIGSNMITSSLLTRHQNSTDKSNENQEPRQSEERGRKSYANVIDGGGKSRIVNNREFDNPSPTDKNNNFNMQNFIDKENDESKSNKIEQQSYVSTFASKDTSIASHSSGYDSKLDGDRQNIHSLEDEKSIVKDEGCDLTKPTDLIIANSMKNINKFTDQTSNKTYCISKSELTNTIQKPNKSQSNMKATNVMGYKSLWIGSISPRCKKNTLEKVFTRYGKITSIHLLSGRLSSIGTISAFVNFDNSESPINAICELRNKYIAYACVDKKSPLQFRLTPDDQHKKTLNKNDAKVRTAQLGECFYWRNYTRGCLRGDDCEFYHIPMNRAIDNPPWLLELTSPMSNSKTV